MNDIQEKARWYVLVLRGTSHSMEPDATRRELVRAYTAADAIASFMSPIGYGVAERRGPVFRVVGVEPYEPGLRDSHKIFESVVADVFGRKEFGG